MPYDNMPFKNNQAAKADTYGRLTASRNALVESYTSGKGTPMGKAEYMKKLNEFDRARSKADPEAFKASVAESRGDDRDRVITTVGGTQTSFKSMTGDNESKAKQRGGN